MQLLFLIFMLLICISECRIYSTCGTSCYEKRRIQNDILNKRLLSIYNENSILIKTFIETKIKNYPQVNDLSFTRLCSTELLGLIIKTNVLNHHKLSDFEIDKIVTQSQCIDAKKTSFTHQNMLNPFSLGEECYFIKEKEIQFLRNEQTYINSILNLIYGIIILYIYVSIKQT